MDESVADNWALGQNIPNPAQSSTSIPFVVPEECNIFFTLMSVNGQILTSYNMHAFPGNNTFTYDISSLSNGIYYYVMTYKGKQKVRKMVIQR